MNQETMLSFEAVKEPVLQAMPDKMELKPERVQQALSRQLGWEERKGARGIHRTRKFASHIEAEAFAAFVFKVAARRRQPVTVGQAGRQVSITLQGLTDAVYDLACALG